MRFLILLWLGALAWTITACGNHGSHGQQHPRYKRQADVEKREPVPASIVSSTKTSTTSSKTTTTSSKTTTKSTTKSTTTSSKTTTTKSTTTSSKTTTKSTTTSAKTSSTSSIKIASSLISTATNLTTTALGNQTVTSEIIPVITTVVNATSTAISNTASILNPTNSTSVTAATASATVQSTILVIARDQTSANQATNGLNAYGIPFQTLIVPQAGIALPGLNSSAGGNFGGLILISGLSYNYGDTLGWQSALTQVQWNQLYAYQIAYGVRMVQWDVYPQPAFGTTPLGSCCDTGVEQLISFSNTDAFQQAGLRIGAGMSTQGLFHYVAQVTDTSTTTEIAQFAANSLFSTVSTAAVINNFAGREQMVFFMTWATDWSATSNYLQHAYITWLTRGLYAGYRRVNINTQIDDMFLRTGIYYPGNSTTVYRVTTTDMDVIKNWVPTIQAKMNPGSWYAPEIGHNGNGNIIAVDASGLYDDICSGGPVYTNYQSTTLEFQKPLGSGTDGWPLTPSAYPYTTDCLVKDPLMVWMTTASNRDAFLHISHTFTHEGEDNATYNDITKEITFNQQWLTQTGINGGNFTANGIIPPAITGLHNGDALRAWWDNGIVNCVGDNSRPLLRNQQNPMWPYITQTAADGFTGMTVVPRWSLRIYYNCDSPACTLQEWIDTSAGSGDFNYLMSQEKADTMHRFFGLYHDGFMFHQLNLRSTNMSAITTADGTTVNSLIQAWTEQAVQEFTRLANWPLITLKQSDLATAFTNRMTRDNCGYTMSYLINSGSITGVTVGATGNTCSVPIPVTVPGPVTNTQGFTTEKIGNDPLTIWVTLSGQPVTFTLSTPIVISSTSSNGTVAARKLRA